MFGWMSWGFMINRIKIHLLHEFNRNWNIRQRFDYWKKEEKLLQYFYVSILKMLIFDMKIADENNSLVFNITLAT